MKLAKKLILLAILSFCYNGIEAQEGLPIYSDYLTDNYYLIHPSMAGVANCNKVRLTGRQQWFGQDNAPSLQTFSINGRIGDTQSGVGAIAFNDQGRNPQNTTVVFPKENYKVGDFVMVKIEDCTSATLKGKAIGYSKNM